MIRKSKYYYAGLNLIAPGIGQFALRSYFRATLMFFAGLFFIIYSCLLALEPIYRNIRIMLQNEQKDFACVETKKLIASVIAMFAIWLWSFLDILLRKNPDSLNRSPAD